jgi:2-enoate reductase
VNPRTGFEDVLARDPIPCIKPKKVAVIGAGPSGMLCAIIAAQRGHYVTLFEKNSRVGGMLVPGSVPKIKYEVKNYLTYLENSLEKACQESSLTLKLACEVTPESLKKASFDSVVVCVGGIPIKPQIPGLDQDNVIQAIDLFVKPELVAPAKNIVVVGAGSVGCEAAHFLASELGKRVTMLEVLPLIMAGMCTANRGHMIHELERLNVDLWNCSSFMGIEGNTVRLARNVSGTVPDPYITWVPILPENIKNPFAKQIKQEIREQTLNADLVVLAMGLRPDRTFYEACVSTQAAPQVLLIGDAFQIASVHEAVKSGSLVGCSL